MKEEKKIVGCKIRDVGTQSSLITEDSSSSPSPTLLSTPSIKERMIKCCDQTQNSTSTVKLNPKQVVCYTPPLICIIFTLPLTSYNIKCDNVFYASYN